MREIASALGLSHQRVHQIVSGGKPIAEARKGTLFNRLVRRNRKECEPGGKSNWFDQIVGQRLYIDAREALTLSQLEARALNHSYLGTEHLLLGTDFPYMLGDWMCVDKVEAVNCSAAEKNAILEGNAKRLLKL